VISVSAPTPVPLSLTDATTVTSTGVNIDLAPVAGATTYNISMVAPTGTTVARYVGQVPTTQFTQLAPGTYNEVATATGPGGVTYVRTASVTIPWPAAAPVSSVPATTTPVVAEPQGTLVVGASQSVTLPSSTLAASVKVSFLAPGFSWHTTSNANGSATLAVTVASYVKPGNYVVVISQGGHSTRTTVRVR
jgi:hypothetical protein